MKNNFNYTIFSKEAIDEQFKQLKIDLKPTMDYKSIIQRFHKILHNRVMFTVIFDSSSDEITIYRITKPWENIDLNNPNSFSYNPNPKINGRAHRTGYPVFYGSVDPFTAFSEMKDTIDINDKFYMSRWKLKFATDTNVHSLIINSLTKDRQHILNKIIKQPHEGLKKMVKNIPDEFQEGYIYAIEKMGDLFTSKGSSNYHITSAYCHEILYDIESKGIKIAAILYPSVENNLSSVNWAIHPSVIDSKLMHIQDVFEMNLIKNDSNKKKEFSVSIHKKGVLNSDSSILWKLPHLTNFNIDYNNLSIINYNGEVLRGENISNLKIYNKDLTIKEWIDKYIDRKKIQEKLPEIHSDSDDNITLEFEEETFMWSIILQLNEGNEIITKSGKCSIKILQIPISWKKEYKSEE